MVWLYSFSELHRAWPITSIHQWLLPALERGQYRIYYKGKKPVGFVTWARMSHEAEQAYVRDTASLKPTDWNNGEHLWAIDFIAPFGDAKGIVHDLRHNVFPDQVGRFLRAKKDEKAMRIMYVHGVDARGEKHEGAKNSPVLDKTTN